MEIEQVAELARAVAALPQGHQDFFNGLVADERAKAAEAERIAEMRAMSDDEIAYKVLEDCTEYAQRHHAQDALKMLREAGFVRLAGKEAETMRAITAGIVSREQFLTEVKLSPGRVEELPAGFILWDVSRSETA